MKYAIIADIAGQYKALMRLVAKIPKDYEIILLGDLIDRGPDSRKVIQWMIENKIRSVYGNHEDMFVKTVTHTGYGYDIWYRNGGNKTIKSYHIKYKNLIPEHIEFLKTLPLMIKLQVEMPGFSEVILTHGTIHKNYKDEVSESDLKQGVSDWFFIDDSIIWNRGLPKRREYLQVSGHNSHWGYREFSDEQGVFSYSIDQSQKKKLTCLLLPDLTLIEEKFA